MSVLIQIQNGSKSFGARNLFQQASFAVDENEHIGVIGPNGAGKSTLFRILVEQDQLDLGQMTKANHLRLGHLAQEDHFESHELVEDFVTKGAIKPIWELKRLALGLGLKDEDFSRPIQELSGGYRMRCKLLALLAKEPNLLLLDEPTNYLDLESLIVLEDFLQTFKGSFLLISHDREFLRRTTDHILEIEEGQFTKFNGNIDDYFEQKQLLREQLEKQALSVEAKKQEVLQFAARFGAKATKARQVQSRLKRMEKMESIEIKSLPVSARIQLPKPVHTGKQVLLAKNVSVGYNNHPVLKNINMTLQRGDHLGVVGHNGAGKSTLLKALAGRLSPISGELDMGYKVEVGYYAQHVAEQLSPKDTVYEALMSTAHPEITPQEVKDLAGSLLFSADDINKPVHILSGGEKARVCLGQILLKKAPFLLLDEPTNHLDFHTVEALTQALHNYEGSLIVVSHDRGFIRRLASQVLEVNCGQVSLYPGTYEEYVWSLEKGILSERESPDQVSPESKGSQSSSSSPKVNFKERRKFLQKSVRQNEKELSKMDREMQTLQEKMEELNQKIIQASGTDAQKLSIELSNLRDQIEQKEMEWLNLGERLESEQNELNELIEQGRS